MQLHFLTALAGFSLFIFDPGGLPSNMSDVKDILGLGGGRSISPPPAHVSSAKPAKKNPEGKSREVFSQLSQWRPQDEVASPDQGPLVPGYSNIFKAKRREAKVVAWTCDSFSSSARTDGCTFKHWRKYDYLCITRRRSIVTYTYTYMPLYLFILQSCRGVSRLPLRQVQRPG
jgi:hypothetical protein